MQGKNSQKNVSEIKKESHLNDTKSFLKFSVQIWEIYAQRMPSAPVKNKTLYARRDCSTTGELLTLCTCQHVNFALLEALYSSPTWLCAFYKFKIYPQLPLNKDD